MKSEGRARMWSHSGRRLAWLILGLVAAVSCRRHGEAGPRGAGCFEDQGLERALLARAANFVADRNYENRFKLPWTSDARPAVVRDAAACRRAVTALSVARGGGSRVASVILVSVGGLYLASPIPSASVGEFTATYVLDREFRLVIALAG